MAEHPYPAPVAPHAFDAAVGDVTASVSSFGDGMIDMDQCTPPVELGTGRIVTEIRVALATDVDRIADLIHGVPGEEAIALLGSPERAYQYGCAVVRNESTEERTSVVAVVDGYVVGVLRCSTGYVGHNKLTQLRILSSIVGPIGVVLRIPKLLARRRVNNTIREDALYVSDVYVDPAFRGRGIGTELLQYAEDTARRRDLPVLSLETPNGSRALSMYKRFGFKATHVAMHPSYARRLHVAGRVLMEKEL